MKNLLRTSYIVPLYIMADGYLESHYAEYEKKKAEWLKKKKKWSYQKPAKDT